MGSSFLGSSISIHTSSIGSKELLVAGCCALALLDACHLTVDCLLLASSAAMLRILVLLTFSPLIACLWGC